MGERGRVGRRQRAERLGGKPGKARESFGKLRKEGWEGGSLYEDGSSFRRGRRVVGALERALSGW